MRNSIASLLLLMTVVPSMTACSQKPQEESIQIALLLDTSNSMDGLIHQAKSQLWKIVNEFALARKHGKIPRLEIALYEYGNNNLSSYDGYIRNISDFTTDLDKISDELFRLSTNGGSEYCGKVIQNALEKLHWNNSKDVLKIIFIAGNEPFTQGTRNYRTSCKEAIAQGIIVNTIFCGNYEEGIRTSWKDGAELADGVYSYIDQDQQIAYISAPQDEEISRLGTELNQTYIAYGRTGVENKKMQMLQDQNALSVAPEVMVQRSKAKASAQYSNERWDLVDAMKMDTSAVSNIKTEELPEEMRTMNSEERIKYIQDKRQKRQGIQNKINMLNEERRVYVEEQQKKSANDNTLDKAVLNAIRTQAKKQNYTFE